MCRMGTVKGDAMKKCMRAFVVLVAMGTVVASGAAQPPPQVPSISQRPTGSSLGTIRAGAADNTIWFGWRVAIPVSAFRQLTLSDALAKADIMSVTGVEASSRDTVSAEVPKKLDYRLRTGERNAVSYRLRELNEQVFAYHVETLGSDAATRRHVFELAAAIRAPILVVPAETSALDEVDRLAEEFAINVALESRTDPRAAMRAIEGRSKRIGVRADLGGWMQAGVKPVDGLGVVKERLLLVNVTDRNALGPGGRDVPLGSGVGALGDFFLAVFRAGVKPLAITVQSTGGTDADIQ